MQIVCDSPGYERAFPGDTLSVRVFGEIAIVATCGNLASAAIDVFRNDGTHSNHLDALLGDISREAPNLERLQVYLFGSNLFGNGPYGDVSKGSAHAIRARNAIKARLYDSGLKDRLRWISWGHDQEEECFSYDTTTGQVKRWKAVPAEIA